MPRPILIAAAALFALSLTHRLAAAESSWDLIYTDHLDLTLCSNGCGITLAGEDFALLVNTGAEDIQGTDFFAATFEVTPSSPEIRLLPFVNNPGPAITPIHPAEALGGVTAFGDAFIGPNDVLLTRLLPGETLHNTYGLQVLAFIVGRSGLSSFEGPVHFDIKMTMGGRVAQFPIDADVHLGDFRLLFPSAARVSSVPIATPATSVSWGRIKAQYH